MGKESKITFTNSTWNPWQGCRKVSAGCKFCYMYRDKERYGADGSVVHRSADRTFNQPLRTSPPQIVFTCSWSDFFISEADGAWRSEAWKIIKQTPHFYLIFTKRPERIASNLPKDWGNGYKNVMLVVSTEDQKTADERIPVLLDTPALYRGASLEPLLGAVNVENYLYTRFEYSGLHHKYNKLDWLVIGGESGNDAGFYRYRPCRLEWIAGLVEQGARAGCAVFVKQLGTAIAKEQNLKSRSGEDVREFPKDLQMQNHIPQIADWLEYQKAEIKKYNEGCAEVH